MFGGFQLMNYINEGDHCQQNILPLLLKITTVQKSKTTTGATIVTN